MQDAQSGEGQSLVKSDQRVILADLYDPSTMPPSLSKAHKILDRAVDELSDKPFAADANCVALLFKKYENVARR